MQDLLRDFENGIFFKLLIDAIRGWDYSNFVTEIERWRVCNLLPKKKGYEITIFFLALRNFQQ